MAEAEAEVEADAGTFGRRFLSPSHTTQSRESTLHRWQAMLCESGVMEEGVVRL